MSQNKPHYEEAATGLSFASAASLGVTPYGQTETLYLLEPNEYGNIISMADINQGGLSDCYLLASLGEIVRQSIYLSKMSLITDMIHVNSNGTETVRLYEDASGGMVNWASAAFKAVYETVTNVFPSYAVNSSPTVDVVGNQKEIWPQVIEKADAEMHGGYGALANGGNAYLAMEEMTGRQASWMSPGVSLRSCWR